ncbi:SDR family oxidoreductase [Labilibaculum antarcticum]|uniref:Vi polysaccharide biosynthesis protein VipB/TviC n=1 Tax=Labilibaculum antarcticum TaxID=1717717 RepID=A0A1Y1CQT7_9BACT|nr:SDR family oxidoreductase [Labilibaculum antarcticum]BAX82640.1 Vi polysaccharide biosynthesis protein VipB/TviC [Labilibaculum antarcticum]
MNRIITNSKVVVTGGAGFIGSNLCEVLLKQNNDVTCLDNFSTGFTHNIEAFLSNPKFKIIEGDIRNYKDCQKAVEGADYVLHQAALGSVPRSIVDPMTATDVNIGGFVKMLHAAAQAKVKRFVYAASSSTYGDSINLPKVEHIIGNALSPYAITKYVDELYAKNFSDLYGIETIGLRYFNVFGRRQDPNGAYAAVIPKFVQTLIKHESPLINGDGSFSRDFTYIDNVIQANQLAAITPTEVLLERMKGYNATRGIASNNSDDKSISEVFNVAFGERTNLNELVQILIDNLSKFDAEIANIQIQHGPNRAGDIPHSLASIEKGKTLLGYEPGYSIRKGLEEATEWYWENLK